MSLTLFFIVLSLAIGYLLYDTFKKSRQKNNKTPESVNNRLKINYTNECTVLNTLSKQKLDSVKAKMITIHLTGDPVEPTQQDLAKCREIIAKLKTSRRVYLIEKKDHNHNSLFKMVKKAVGAENTFCYHSVEGAVAILRQLLTGTGGIHLESERQLYTKIKQYLTKIWLVGQDLQQQALREFKTQVQMISFLSNLQIIEQEQAN